MIKQLEKFLEIVNDQGIPVQDNVGKKANPNDLVNYDLCNSLGYIPEAKNLPRLDPKYKVVIEDEQAQKVWNLIKINAAVNNHSKNEAEIGFIMFGYEEPDGKISVKIIHAHTTAGFRKIATNQDYIDNVVNAIMASTEKSEKKPFLIFGHTHPSQTHLRLPNEFANSWSFQDLYSTWCYSDRYKNELQTANCLITPSLDVNLLFFDQEYKNFYRFSEGVYSKNEYGKMTAEPSYGNINAEPKKFNPKLTSIDLSLNQ